MGRAIFEETVTTHSNSVLRSIVNSVPYTKERCKDDYEAVVSYEKLLATGKRTFEDMDKATIAKGNIVKHLCYDVREKINLVHTQFLMVSA